MDPIIIRGTFIKKGIEKILSSSIGVISFQRWVWGYFCFGSVGNWGTWHFRVPIKSVEVSSRANTLGWLEVAQKHYENYVTKWPKGSSSGGCGVDINMAVAAPNDEKVLAIL